MSAATNPNGNMQGIDLYDDTNHQTVKARAKNVSTDSSVTPNVVSGDLGIDVEVVVNAATSSTGPLTQVNASITSVSLLAANANRKGAYFYNNSSNNLYLAYGATAATSAFTVKIGPSVLFEMPTSPVWQGAVSGIWDGTNGNVQITELS